MRVLLKISVSSIMILLSAYVTIAQNNVIEVRGRLIDVRVAERGSEAYPQYKGNRFGKSLPDGSEGMSYAVSLKDFPGPEEVRSWQKENLLISICGPVADTSRWKPIGESFNINTDRYYFYSTENTNPGEWVKLPVSEIGAPSKMVWADKIRVAETEQMPGTVIARTPELRTVSISNPNIIIASDGSYLAACSNSIKGRGTDIFRSIDEGKTWNKWSKGHYPINFFTLFEHGDRMYMIGVWTKKGHIIICESEDMGRTWTFPSDDDDFGVLFTGRYHSAPVPVVSHAGRLWRSFETDNEGEQRRSCIISCKEGADLMNPSNWVMTNELDYDSNWKTMCNGGAFRQWIEGCLVKTREGELVNVIRVDEHEVGRTAAIIHVDSRKKISFDPKTDIIEMPGGGKKFTIRYDSESGKYWALVNPADEHSMEVQHGGIYAKGIHAGLIRNRLVLISSTDLRNWNEERTIIESDNPFFDGFQYADWQFDGEDIISVIRTAMEEERGLPQRQHDANMLVFVRVKDFRHDGERILINTLK
jgi:hypothetical protein